jgi:hypothetical protein
VWPPTVVLLDARAQTLRLLSDRSFEKRKAGEWLPRCTCADYAAAHKLPDNNAPQRWLAVSLSFSAGAHEVEVLCRRLRETNNKEAVRKLVVSGRRRARSQVSFRSRATRL